MKQTAKTTPDILTFAHNELNRFLPEPQVSVELQVDKSLSPGSFAGNLTDSGIQLSGADESCILHAVYTFLEQIGWHFEITGPVKLAEADITKFKSFSISPVITQRGIRQHINFPMDISSYTIEEAREYIRNLARLRYNHITFHSYPNQWIDGEQDGDLKTAGAFFYGQQHDIPEHQLLKQVINNEKTYCIPEIEPYLNDEKKRSAMAISWLQEVMAEAKNCGLHIQFSFEPRCTSKDLSLTLSTCRHILELYPMIDTLELISTESGGWGETNSEEAVRQALADHYSDDLLNSSEFNVAINSGKANFDCIMEQLAHLLLATQSFKNEAASKDVRIALGVYCVLPEFHSAIFRVIKEQLPKDTPFAILPEHSSERVADALGNIKQDDEDWKRTFIYSWLEFDGTMYLQQNGVKGLERLFTILQDKAQGMAFNHWRTAENQLVARYASESCIYGCIPAEKFYKSYASQLGIGDPEAFVRAHEIMAESDWMATNKLFNIGFCYYGCWGRQGLGYFEKWNIEDIIENHNMFEQAHKLLNQCAKTTASAAGREFLSFLDNRVRCTMVYLKAMAKGSELQAFKGLKPEQLSDEQKAELIQICDHAIAQIEQYMALHAEAMPDRGCEGTLISVYHVPTAVLKRIRQDYANIPSDQPHSDVGHDEPPSPIEW